MPSFVLAQAAPASGSLLIQNALPLVAVFMIFYFLILRPQQKRQKEHAALIADLKKGTRVVTSGGIVGTVASIRSDVVVLKLGDNGRIDLLKQNVTGLYSASKTGANGKA